MSFLDRVTKAVGDVVDRGKQEVGQFVRIQKINGEIGQMEKKITEFKGQIQTATHPSNRVYLVAWHIRGVLRTRMLEWNSSQQGQPKPSC